LHIERTRPGAARQDEQPSLYRRIQFPDGFRRKRQSLEHEVWAGNQQCSCGVGLRSGRCPFGPIGVRGRNGGINVKLSAPAVVKEPERRITSLLDLHDHQSRPDGMNRPRGHQSGVARSHCAPLNLFGNGAITNGRS
jgi:hypothetical protein